MNTPVIPPNPHAGDKAFVQRVLIDFDLRDPTQQVIDSNPADLTDIPMQAVRTLYTQTLTITIYAHEGEGQDVAQLLEVKENIIWMILTHGQMHADDGVADFTINALTDTQWEHLQQVVAETKAQASPDGPPPPR